MKSVLGIDVGSIEIKAAIARNSINDEFTIIGFGKCETAGIKKGIITNVEQAKNSIKKAVDMAKKSSGTGYDKVVVSISGASLKSKKVNATVSITSNDNKIVINDIRRAMEIIETNIAYETDYRTLHILPYIFKVDDNFVEDPLGLNGNRLQVFCHVILASNNALSSLTTSIKSIGIEIDNIVYSAYASGISTLHKKDEKEAGVAIIDMGGATCNCAIYYANSIINNFTFPIGSANITYDISNTIKTPVKEAEEIKLNYYELVEDNISHLELPVMGDNTKIEKVSLETITDIIHSRIFETLVHLDNSIEKLSKDKETSSLMLPEKINHVVLTGGMTKVSDLLDFALITFSGKSVRIEKAKSVSGLYEVSDDLANSCVVGLCMYGSKNFTPYEIDSNGEILYKNDSISTIKKPVDNQIDIGLPNESEVSDIQDGKNKALDIVTKPVKKMWKFLLQLY